MTRRRTRTNLPYATQVLRKLLADSNMKIADLAEATNLPVERIRTLTRGNAPMRIDEAGRIALVFGRKTNIFLEEENDTKARRSEYVLAHQAEVHKFQEALDVTLSLRASFKKYSEDEVHKSAPPKYCYYDGTMGKASAIVAKETLLTDTLFSDIEYLNDKNTILLAGSKGQFLPVATTYMRRWWDEKTRPEDVTKIKMLGESKEKERCGQYRELMAAFDRAEAFGDASFNPALIELEHMLDTSTVNPKPTSLQQAERLYCQSLTNLKKYEYFRFVQTLMKQQSPQKEMIFGDTFNECLTVLAELGAIHPSVARANINALGIQPIRAEYSIILHEMSDTELARIILSDAEFTWFFSPDGRIVASDGLTVIAHSIEEVAACMRRRSFFAGDKPNHSTGIIWDHVPHSEKDFITDLGLSDLSASEYPTPVG